MLEDLTHQPGAVGDALRGVSNANMKVDLLYLTVAGSVVLYGTDLARVREAAGV